MAKIWTVLANTNLCRIYEYHQADKTLKLVEELSHPSSRLKGKDLITDKPGRYRALKSAKSAFEPNLNPKEIEVQRFAQEIAHALEAGKNSQQYEQLILIIPAKMAGLLNASAHKTVKESVIENIHKDYLNLTEREILETLKPLQRPKC